MGQKEPRDHHKLPPSTVGALLRRGREAKGLSLTQAASLLQTSRTHLTKLELDQYEQPSPLTLARAATEYNLSLADLYAAAGYTPVADLPDLGPYLRARHKGCPDEAIQALEAFYEFIKDKYSLQ